MVSIPDWSRLGRLGEVQKEIEAPGAKYYKQREIEAIKQAQQSGYFLDVSKEYIADRFIHETPEEKEKLRKQKSFLDQDLFTKDLGKVQFVKLSKAHVKSLGDISLCHNLSVCILNGNYITKIDALAACTGLVKLDLHNNQITVIPGSTFWENMEQLQILHLHDNPIGKIENVHNLAHCPELTILTLFDTPLSLKRNYRHHVVNSVWTLKALDDYVISDEEIIEDAVFGGHYSTMHPSFAVNLCPQLPADSTLSEEIELANLVMGEVNRILAHHSPVLMIQKYIRGFLTRRAYKMIQDTRTWSELQTLFPTGAATTVQRQYREWKDSPRQSEAPPPPSSPVPEKPPAATPSEKSQPQREMTDAQRLDYDTYMKHRRPGSTTHSESSNISKLNKDASELKPPGPTLVPIKSPSGDARTHIFINLAKLHMDTLQSLQDDQYAMSTALEPTEASYLSKSNKTKPEVVRKRRLRAEKRNVVKHQKQFFGPVVTGPPATPESMIEKTDDEDEVPVINFRLRGKKEEVKVYDPTTDMIIANKDVGREIRQMENEFHRKTEYAPKPKVESKKPINVHERMFSKVQGTMGFSCLRAVQQAYKDREKAEKKAANTNYIMALKEQREIARDRINIFKEDKRRNALKAREREQKRIIDILERREMQRLNEIDQSQQLRGKSSHFRKHLSGELTFISDFNVQNTSVSNALLRHDRQAMKEDKQQDNMEFVRSKKETEQEQQDVVRKYLEHRSLMRQTESAMARAALDTRMLQEANDRLILARSRVAQRQSRSSQMETVAPVPSMSAHSLPPISPEKRKEMHGLDRWNSSALITSGRVGKHHTSVVTTS